MTLLNKATGTSYELAIGQIPTSTVGETKDVLLQLFQTVIPGMDIPTIDATWMGVRARRDSSGGIDFQDWSISFFVNNDFSNWKTMHDWMKYAAEGKITPKDHNISAVLSIKNNFGETIMRVMFSNVWLKSLGEVTLNTQSGEDFLQGTATLDYGRYDVYQPDDIVEW
jgi:hypothetical protein